ncbi:YSIRK-type signal peptide-containing protein, partial [Lactobacillus intestinalis]|uniref:YSIRK-type signal peptide-containing protein n=1 Tax=Lactobacillus intestinalis TaxID=151781 RepID=UPI0026665CC3
MFSKRNIKLREEKNRDEKQRFSIRKLTIGATSVLVGVSFFMYGAQSASAATTDDAPVVEKSATEPSKEDGNEVGESNNDSKNNTEINMENSNGSGEAQRDVTPGTQSEKTEISKKAKNSVETTDKATKNVDNQSPTQPSSTDNTVKTEKDNSESKRDSSLETGNKAASQNVIESHDKQTSPSVKTADEPKIVDNTHESTNVTTAENSKATQTENAPAVNNTTSTEIQNNARDIGSQKNTNSSTLASQDANSKINQKNANSDTIELKVPTANKKVEMSEDIDAKTVALNLKDTKHELTNNMNTVESEKIATSSVKNRAMLLTSLIAEDPNTVTVSDAKGFINAIQNGTATTINVAKDLNLASEYDGNYRQRVISHKRDILIQSATPGVKHTIDFSGNSFSMNTQNSVTFKDLDLYERSYWGIVYNAGGYVFDNVNFAGSQLIYTESSINSTLTFKNNVTATAVGSYTGPIDGESRPSQGGNTQQILQFVGGTNHIIFDENSNVTLGTTNSNVLEIDGGTTTIDVKNGVNVTINPHSKGNPENRNSIGTGSIARAIASNANTTINVDKGANLTINTEKASGDSDVAGALYLNSDAKFNVNGNLNINSNGTPSTKNNGYPVYIAGNAAINVGNGGKFNLSATNTGSYSDNLMSISGKGTVKLAPHSNFKISADGTGALTAINLSSGSTFTSDQPDAFTIDLSQNTSTGKSLIRNGTINFSRVKTMATDGTTSEPLGKIDVTYDRNGNATTYTITSLNEDTVKQVGEGLANKNLIDFVKASEDVTLSNLHLSKDNVLTGTVASSGSDNPIYVTVTVGGVSTNIPVVGNYTVYTNTKGTVTSNNVDYAAQTASTGGNFSIDLSKLASSLTNDAQVAVTATKDFVEAAQTKSVAALRALNIATLQELVDAAPEEEAKPSYYNATEEAQKAYTDAISTGKTILADQNNYDQVDVDAAVTAIQNAQKALTGKETNKTELQAAIDQASTVESSDNYTNADSNLQKAYTDAISAGQTVLNKENVTQSEVDNALTTINNAKAALNGDAKKAASKEALQKAVDEAPTVKSDDAAYYNGSDEAKAAYDKAISAGQTVLADPDATATQITDTLNAINTAKSNLKGKATDKAALQTAVDNSATVKESNNYTNADQTQKSAYDNAVTAAQTVLDKTNATQAEVNQALQDLETANNNLNGDAKTEAANKAALEAAVKDAPNVRNTPAYYNGSEEAQTAYNSAINAGQAVLDQANPSANDVKTALDKINAARANLKGVATNTEALEKALTNANDAKKTGNYTNADQANQEALNNAITAGQEILKNTNATQAQIDSAAKAITDAISGLNGDT